MFEEAENLDVHPYFRTKHDSEGVVRSECTRPWRVYRPGIVVGNSETGEMDKVDGPYYFFKLIRRIRNAVPQWMPMPGVEGREINLVPVDFVVRAMDHIAHTEGLDGRAFHLTDPRPPTAGEVIDIFARAANAPQSSVRLPAAVLDAADPFVRMGLSAVPLAGAMVDRTLADFGVPRAVLTYVNYPTHFDSRGPRRHSPIPTSGCRRWRPTPTSSGTTGSATSTPTCSATARCSAPCADAGGWSAALAQVLEQQIPDEFLRLGRRVLGSASLETAVRGKVVMVTGASSGIGRSAALKIADAGGIVLLVARTPEKLEATREQIEAGGGIAHVYPCDLADMDALDEMAQDVLAEHGHVDILVNNAGRSIRRSIALSYDRFHDFERTIQLNYFGPLRLILNLLPAMRDRKSGHIINISSIGVQTNTPRFSAYVASKSALDAFSRCIASEIVDDGVNITAIYMPLVRTPMIKPTKMYDRFPTITPEEAAEMINEAIIHKPKRIATPLGTLGQLLYAINPKSIDYILNSAYKLFPDSSAAKGEEKKAGKAEDPRRVRTTDEQASNEQVAFAYLMRGIHW